MRKLAVVVLVTLGLLTYARAKGVEHQRNSHAVSEFMEQICAGKVACKERLDLLSPCLTEAYDLSPIPGRDSVDLAALTACLNGSHPVVDIPSVARGGPPVPFPTR